MPRVLSVVSPGNGSGKTRLVTTLLEWRRGAFTAVKFTTVYRDGQNCPKTETACACRALHGMFTIITDPAVIAQENTDTGRMVRSGASRTLWGLAIPSAHALLWRHLVSEVLDPDELVISEGNRIVPVIAPDAVVMVIGPEVPRARWKSDTWDLIARADLVVVNDYAPAGSRPSAPAAALKDEIRDRASAPVIVQDVAVPLAVWDDGRLRDLAAALLDGASYPRPAHPVAP